MKLLPIEEFQDQWLRAAGYSCENGAEIGECLAIAEKLQNAEVTDWKIIWEEAANRLIAYGKESLSHGNPQSAYEAWIRAGNYYRTAYFFLYNSHSEELLELYKKHTDSFQAALALSDIEQERTVAAIENCRIPIVRYRPKGCQKVLPLLILTTGYDGTIEETFLAFGFAALRRGYQVVCYEGPGQGGCLIEQHQTMRFDWENVFAAVWEAVTKMSDIDSTKITLLGYSFGGYLAARAAAFRPELHSLIVIPGVFDIYLGLQKMHSGFLSLVSSAPAAILNTLVNQALSTPIKHLQFASKLWIHGKATPAELIYEWKNYSLKGLSDKIKCPTLVCDSEHEPFLKGQAQILYNSLSCPKKYHLFTHSEGAAAHCAAGNLRRLQQVIFD